MKTEILKVKGDWMEVVDDCRSTVGKPPLGKEPSVDFKRGILIAEHSPIRDLSVRWKWSGIKYWVAMHWKTHHWESKVTTQRSDRTGENRDESRQDALVDFTGEANAQHLIDTMRKRLCYQAHPETREYAESLKMALRETQPEISNVLVPNCVYRCGCCEMKSCGYFNELAGENSSIRSTDIQKRYDAYNRIFVENYAARNPADAVNVDTGGRKVDNTFSQDEFEALIKSVSWRDTPLTSVNPAAYIFRQQNGYRAESLRDAAEQVKELGKSKAQGGDENATERKETAVDGKQEPDNVRRHRELCDALNSLYAAKNADYGDSFHASFLEEGFAMARVRLSDKLNRFKTLTKSGNVNAKDESIRDTLIDLANYSLMTVLEIDAQEEWNIMFGQSKEGQTDGKM